MMQQALLHLVDGEILGNDEYRFPAGSGDINWSDKTIAAYNRMTTPLPITGKDPDNGIWHITTGKNLDEQREEPQQPEVFGICESEHYGRDFNQRVRNRNSTSSRARAAAAQRRYSSV